MTSAFIWAVGFISSLGVPNWYLDEALCLTEAIHYEANGEHRPGKRGVANVIITRQEHARFPSTYCNVLDASGAFDHRNRELTLMDVVLTEPGDITSFAETLYVVRVTLNGELVDNTGGATHFYNPHAARPFWGRPEDFTSRIGNHQYVRVYP
jgi:spore germination cell wall hydrolase CwlJ-like protein